MVALRDAWTVVWWVAWKVVSMAAWTVAYSVAWMAAVSVAWMAGVLAVGSERLCADSRAEEKLES